MEDPNSVTPPASDSVEAAADPRLDKLLEKVSLLEQLIVRRIKDDQVHQNAYNTLYQDMARYRDDAFRSAQKPLLKGMLLLYDAMGRTLESAGEAPLRADVQLHREELLELLHRHEVSPMRDTPRRFDPKVQTAIATEDAVSAEEDQAVVRIVREGFRWGPHVLRPEEVIIKVWRGT